MTVKSKTGDAISPSRGGGWRLTGDFTMADILTFAGVDPTSRGQ